MGNLRPRSAGVTAAATLVILGCSSAFILWGVFLLNLLNAPLNQDGKHFYELYPVTVLLLALVPSIFMALGIRTGIGLFQLRPWARMAALVWACISLAFCLTLIALRPFETFFIPDHFVGPLESLKQLISIAVVILLLPVSVWWLFLFRAKSVKEQFQVREEEEARELASITHRT
jgi:hypothetical protein